MLVDLRAIGMDIANGGPTIISRAVSFRSLSDAVASNISAFFQHSSLKSAAALYALTESWFDQFEMGEYNYFQFKYVLQRQAQGWMQMGKQHHSGLTFAAKHLLNVITLWPQQQVFPSLQQKAKGERRKLCDRKKSKNQLKRKKI